MTTFLKQSTAVTIKLGPFVDSTDGATAETALTIAQADVRLSKNGAAFAQKNDATSATHDENGWYGVPLNTTDTGTLGILQVAVTKTGALPCWAELMVVPANVWDSLFGADRLIVDVEEIGAAIITATAIAADAIGASELAADAVTEIQSGLATAAALTTVDTVVDAIKAKTDNLPAAPADDTSIDTQLATIAGYLDTEVAAILAAVDTEVAAILADTNELQTDWANGGRLDMLLDGASAPSAPTVADAVWDEALAGHAGAGSAGAALSAATAPTAAAVADAVWDEAIAGHLTAGTTGNKLNTAAAAAGAGAITFTYTLTSAVDATPIADADVWVTSDAAGTTVLASGKTDQNGQVTFYLDAGTVYVWRQKTGWNFTNPDSEVVA